MHKTRFPSISSIVGEIRGITDCLKRLSVPLLFVERCEWMRGLHKRGLWAALCQPPRWVQLHLQGRLQSTNGRRHQVSAWVSQLNTSHADVGVGSLWFPNSELNFDSSALSAVCDPPCNNYGVCIAPNSCDCPPGYPGPGCSGTNLGFTNTNHWKMLL